MENFDKTMKFDYEELPTQDVRDVLNNVYRTLDERGYNAVNQIVGYLLSGDLRIFHAKMKQEIKFVILIEMLLWKSLFLLFKKQNK